MEKESIPYFKNSPSKSDYFKLFKFLKRKFFPYLRKRFDICYLETREPRKYLKLIQKYSHTNPFFLRFDIEKYFPSIDHRILLDIIKSNYQELTKKPLSRRFKRLLQLKLPLLLAQSPIPDKSLPLGNAMSYILGYIYLLGLDLKIKNPFLRYMDDYVIFAKSEKELEILLKFQIIPYLKKLDLQINISKLKIGKVPNDELDFLGFSFKGGYFGIEKEKVEEFKRKIVQRTPLRHSERSEESPTNVGPKILKKVNHLILGFGHYYKIGSTLEVLRELDVFIRERMRRFISPEKKKEILFGGGLTNQYLKKMGLKSLEDIKTSLLKKQARPERSEGSYLSGKRKLYHKSRLSRMSLYPKTSKTGHNILIFQYPNISNSKLYQAQLMILEKLDELTSLLEEILKKLEKW